MRHFHDGGRRPVLTSTGVALCIGALTVLVPLVPLVPVHASAATTSVTSRALPGDALYQPVPFGALPSFDTSDVAYDFPVVGMAATPGGGGYWMVAADGGVFSFGNAQFYGSAAPLRLTQPIVGMAATPDGKGYWLVAADGGIFTYGDATFYGSMGNTVLDEPIVGMAATPDGGGYWLAGADGGVFSFGDAPYDGNSLAAVPTTGGTTTVGIASDPAGRGYWLVRADGSVAAFGAAVSYGSTAGVHLNAPIVGLAPTSDGGGYSEVASDGGVFAFGDAKFYGSLGGRQITYPIAGIAADPMGGGYWLLPITTVPIATLGTWTGIEPALMQFSGDAGNIVTDIEWSSWNDSSAVGEGTWPYDDCIPDCAGGAVKDFPARITLSDPSGGRFTQLTEEQSGPDGQTFTFATRTSVSGFLVGLLDPPTPDRWSSADDDRFPGSTAPQGAGPLTFGAAAPHPMVDVVHQCVVQTFLTHRACGADLLRGDHTGPLAWEEEAPGCFLARASAHPIGIHRAAPFPHDERGLVHPLCPA